MSEKLQKIWKQSAYPFALHYSKPETNLASFSEYYIITAEQLKDFWAEACNQDSRGSKSLKECLTELGVEDE